MKKFFAKFIVGLTALSIVNVDAEACTIMLVTKGASADGSVIVSHSNDGFGGDPNIVFVPAKNHPKGSLRPVYPSSSATGETMPEYNCFDCPYLVAPERSDAYNFPNLPQTKPLGHIPQVEHTYAYIDGEYGVMNEHGLMMSECTDRSDHLPVLDFKEGGGIFYSSELSRVALERCKTARKAIELMGKLIDEFGLYGTAEALFVADKNEGWLFEMQPTPSGGGVWIAEKIPDGHFSIAANQLRIRAIRDNDPNQIFNPNLPQMLEKLGWAAYDEQGNLDWVKSLHGNEWNHPYYSMRRVWRGLSTVAPSKNFSPTVDGWDSDYYPLSVRPDKKLAVTDLISLYRDYYQGTEFDTTASPLAGLFGSPYHFEREKGERSILTAKTAFSYVAQVNDKFPAPICWVSINTPFENPFVPFAVAKMPAAYEKALRDTYDPSKMFWASSQIMALNQGFWNIMSPIIAADVAEVEKNSLKLVESSLNLSAKKFAETLNQNAVKIFNSRKNLYTRLLIEYNSGAGVKYDARHLPDPGTPSKY